MADVIIGSLAACVAIAMFAFSNRVRFAKDSSTFACRAARTTRRGWQRDGLRWGWFRTRAKWVNDVLILQTGPLWIQSLAIAVRLPTGAQIEAEPTNVVRRLGPRPQSLWIDCGDVLPLKIAVREQDRTKLAGPFVAAAIGGLPTPPRRNRRPAA